MTTNDVSRAIRELTGCSYKDAISIELAARMLNRGEELRAVEALTHDEFVSLVERAERVVRDLKGTLRKAIGGEDS